MLEQDIEIINKLGLHARAAAKLVSTAASYACRVQLDFGGKQADAKSIMAVMMLAAAKGSLITVRCDGDDEKIAMDAVVELIDSYFGEDE
ncbi:MAG: phosphocarrier protein HPr [Arenicella sp.]|jgi:phosphocarrier protein HPr